MSSTGVPLIMSIPDTWRVAPAKTLRHTKNNNKIIKQKIKIDGWMNEREREMFYLTMHSTHFIYSYMASDIWLRTILIVRKETCCRHIGYSYRLAARVLLYAPSHRQDSTYHGLCYTSRGALAGTRNSWMNEWIKLMLVQSTNLIGMTVVEHPFMGWQVHNPLSYFVLSSAPQLVLLK